MKKILFIATLLLFYGCKAVYIPKELKSNLFDKFDYYGNWNDESKSLDKFAFNTYIYKEVEFDPNESNDASYIYIYPQKRQFYTIYAEYNKINFNLKKRGNFFGEGTQGEGSMHKLKIGIWYEYDYYGKLIKTIDEDKKFGKFGYNELLQFLDKEKEININKGVQRDNIGKPLFDVLFHYSDKSDKKLWLVIIYKPEDREYKNGYFIDGNTGMIIEGTPKGLNYYREIGVEF
ncbi:hypothetical protein HNQ02_001491 [Flavobacterium sp. 7E]|uniref:hypothetical protein n=1 Tax=Flavobacterium sp. 7E TaxID=2735898 RepID=UPI00156F7422|nr:hypothetical protein [Flavobacterium sp. 7E]NRS88577.1 hypothetical protein [Flavobacterium sp. 7E]